MTLHRWETWLFLRGELKLLLTSVPGWLNLWCPAYRKLISASVHKKKPSCTRECLLYTHCYSFTLSGPSVFRVIEIYHRRIRSAVHMISKLWWSCWCTFDFHAVLQLLTCTLFFLSFPLNSDPPVGSVFNTVNSFYCEGSQRRRLPVKENFFLCHQLQSNSSALTAGGEPERISCNGIVTEDEDDVPAPLTR